MRIKVRWLAIGLMLLILVAACSLQEHVRAQATNQYFVLSPVLSLGPDQATQFTLFVPGGLLLRAKVKLVDEHNRTILDSPVISIPAGLPYTWTFTHQQVAEATTSFGINNFRLFVQGNSPEKINAFVVSILTINNSTGAVVDGTSNTIAFGESLSGWSFDTDQIPGTITQNYMVSVKPGQPLLISILNPGEPRSFGEPITFTATVTSNGNVTATSPVITIPEDEFRTASFNTTNWPPDPLTGRANVRVTTVVSAASGRDPLNIKRFVVIDPSTLNTMWEAGDQCLVFFLGGRG
jgi:hypothetical protein